MTDVLLASGGLDSTVIAAMMRLAPTEPDSDVPMPPSGPAQSQPVAPPRRVVTPWGVVVTP